MIAIRGGDVLTTDGWQRRDLLVVEGKVELVEPGTGTEADIVVDAIGCIVGPGFVDLHTHLREPGQTWKEDISSGARAAAAGGYTAITAMPNTDPPMDSAKVVEEVLAAAAERAIVEVFPSAAVTVGRLGTDLVDFEELYTAGVRMFTDDGDSVAEPGVLAAALRQVTTLPGAFVAQHAEDRALTVDGHMHDGVVSRRLGLGGLPAAAESEIVARDLALVAETGGRYHCQHVSAEQTVDSIRRAKESGLAVTAEVTPHHLVFDESWLEDLDPDFKMYPPLRSAKDRESLVRALGDGTIDAVATDHAPHTPHEKAAGFVAAPRGVIGLETAAAATWEALGGHRDRMFAVMSIAPARILGIEEHGGPIREGGPANLVVFDPSASWVANEFESRSSNSPFKGREMTGQVTATICRGRVAYAKGTR